MDQVFLTFSHESIFNLGVQLPQAAIVWKHPVCASGSSLLAVLCQVGLQDRPLGKALQSLMHMFLQTVGYY